MTWNVGPWVARKYLTEVAEQFEDYTENHFAGDLSRTKAEPSALLAALKYVHTRGVEGQEATLREIFTSPRGARPKIAETCLQAILTTSSSRDGTARFFATVATDPGLSVSLYAEQGLWQLKPESVEALLDELLRPYDGPRLRRIARLVRRLTDVRPPRPILFWQEATRDKRAAAIASWKRDMVEAGVLAGN
jgi:hypothetical protein